MRNLVIYFLAGSLSAAITNVHVIGTTARQAAIIYTVSGSTPCLVEVSESPTYSPLIPDTDETLYTGAGHDNRTGSLGSQVSGTSTQRTFVAGSINAGVSLNGYRYGRSLSTNTSYYYRINNDSACDAGGPVTGSFVTTTIPLGQTYVPTHMGELGGKFSWPYLDPTGAATSTDPQTGLKSRHIWKPGSAFVRGGNADTLGSNYDAGGTWTNSGAFPTAFSAATKEKLFIPFGTITGIPAYGTTGSGYLAFSRLNLTGHGATSASSANRQVDVCIGFTNGTCVTGTNTVTLDETTDSLKEFGDTVPGFTGWINSTGGVNFDYQMVLPRTGGFTVTGNYIIGGPFLPQQWGTGTLVQLTGSGCPASTTVVADSLNSDLKLKLAASLTGCTSGTYNIPGLGFILSKHTTSTDTITLTSATYDWAVHYNAEWVSSAMQHFGFGGGDVYCSNTKTAAGGRLCEVGALQFYVIYPDGRSLYKGAWDCPNYNGNNDCTPNNAWGFSFDSSDINTIYTGHALTTGDSFDIVKLVFNGNLDTDNVSLGDTVPACGSTPCVTVTTIAHDTDKLLRTFDPSFYDWCCTSPYILGSNSDGTLQFWVYNNQDQFGWRAVFDPSGLYTGGTPNFIASRPSWRGYPSQWGSVHSYIAADTTPYYTVGAAGQVNWVGTLTSTASAPTGPYRIQNTSGVNLSTQTVTCPSRPSNSPIPVELWPLGKFAPGQSTGPVCVTFQIDGEPIDPSPWVIQDTNATVTGTNTVHFSIQTYNGFIGKVVHFVQSGGDTVIQSITPSTGIAIVSPPVANGTAQTANIAVEALCPVGVCAEVGGYKQDLQVGDILFYGYPTSFPTFGVPASSCYHNPHQISATDACGAADAEVYEVLTKTGRGPGATIVAMAGFPGIHTGYGDKPVSSWSGPAYMYLSSPLTNFPLDDGTTQFGSFWNYLTSPLGLSYTDTFDFYGAQGHQFISASQNSGVYGNPPGLCAAGGVTYPNYTGTADTDCYGSRLGTNLSYTTNSSPAIQSFNGPFHGVAGQGTPNSGPDSHPYGPANDATFVDGRPCGLFCNGGLSTGTRETGSLFYFNAAARGCGSGSTGQNRCALNDKILPVGGACGNLPLTNVSGSGVTIGGTSTDAYKFVLIYSAADVSAWTSTEASVAVGDAFINCPGASVIGSSDGLAANTISIDLWYNGPGHGSNTQTIVARPSPNGEATRWLGHAGIRNKLPYAYWNNRKVDNLLFTYTNNINGYLTSVVSYLLPPLVVDSVNRQDFIPVKIKLSGQSTVRVHFGYVENGPSDSYFCTPRAEVCVTDTVISPFAYLTSDSPSHLTDCSSSCTITIPAISGRILYYAIDNGSTVGATQVIPVP